MTIRGVIPTILKSEAVDPSHDGHVIAWDHAKRRGVLVPGGGSSGGAFEAQTTALISGGEISKVSDTEIHIAAGTGQIVDSYSDDAHRQTPSVVPVSWIEQTLTVPALNAETVQWVFIDSAGAVLFMASFVPSLFRTHVILGVVYADPSQSKIFSALPSPVHLNSRGQLLEDLSILHTKIEGSEIFPNVPPGLTFRVLEGLGFFPGIRAFASPDNPNINNLPAADPVAFVYMTQLGASLDATDIDPTQYDDGGTLTPLSGSPRTSTIQVVFRGLGGQVVVLWGQEHYSNLNRALNAVPRYLSTAVVPAALKTRRVKLIGLIVLKRTTSDLTDISKCVFFQRGQAIGGATSNVSKLDDLSDVDTTTTLPADQDILTYDDASGMWLPQAGGSGGIPSRIEDSTGQDYVDAGAVTDAVNIGVAGVDIAGFNPTSIQLIPPVWLRSDGTIHNSVLKPETLTAQQQLTLPDATGMVPAVATAETLEDGQLIRTSGKGYKRIPQGSDGQVLKVVGSIPAWRDESAGVSLPRVSAENYCPNSDFSSYRIQLPDSKIVDINGTEAYGGWHKGSGAGSFSYSTDGPPLSGMRCGKLTGGDANETKIRSLYQEGMGILSGRYVTFSCYIKGTGTAYVQMNAQGNWGDGNVLTLSGSWQRSSVTVAWGNSSSAKELYLVTTGAGPIYFSCAMLSHGASDTIWTPGASDKRPAGVPSASPARWITSIFNLNNLRVFDFKDADEGSFFTRDGISDYWILDTSGGGYVSTGFYSQPTSHLGLLYKTLLPDSSNHIVACKSHVTASTGFDAYAGIGLRNSTNKNMVICWHGSAYGTDNARGIVAEYSDWGTWTHTHVDVDENGRAGTEIYSAFRIHNDVVDVYRSFDGVEWSQFLYLNWGGQIHTLFDQVILTFLFNCGGCSVAAWGGFDWLGVTF